METIAAESKISNGVTEDAFNVKGRRHEAEAFEFLTFIGQEVAGSCGDSVILCWPGK